MDEKINLKIVGQYSEQYAEKILNAFFANHTRIGGPQILQLCEIKQVNLFVLHELFKAWKGENEKIESPYFDYSSKAVKEALEVLMQALSNNISVDRNYFTPLLIKAVRNTLLLILDPYDFFSDLIAGDTRQSLQIDSFREQLKYLKINKAPLERLLQKLQEQNKTELSGNEAFALLDQILEEVNFTPEDVEAYLEKFSAVVPLNIEKFYERKATPQNTVRAVNQPKSEVTAQAKPSINDNLSHMSRPAFSGHKIARIRESLTINQKFMFTKVLFRGDFELFSKAIDELDKLENMNAAMHYLEQNHEDWDKESEEFHEFMELIEKRFT